MINISYTDLTLQDLSNGVQQEGVRMPHSGESEFVLQAGNYFSDQESFKIPLILPYYAECHLENNPVIQENKDRVEQKLRLKKDA